LVKEAGIGFDQIKKRIDRASMDLKNAKILLATDEIGAYRMAYDSMLQIGIALILSYGYRPKVNGFHKTVVECVKEILGDDYSVIVKKFDQMRRNRHEAIYDIGVISSTEAIEAINSSKKFIEEIIKHINTNNPQKELL
jgi:uncharacterized protein (UPF0332 family)